MKTTEQCFHVATFESLGNTILTKATEQYFPVVLFIMPYKVVLNSEPRDEILRLGYSNESY